MIAADVNNSRSITTLDLIQLRRWILGVDVKFSNNTSWRFVRRDYVFPNPANPWAEEFPELLNVNDLYGALNNRDFVAVKIGDVNGNAVANGLVGSEPRSNAGTFEVHVSDATLKTGNEYTVAFTAKDLASVQGYQFTLGWDRNAAEVIDIIGGIAKEDNFGMFPSQGLLTTSWNGEARGNDVLFSVVLRARSEVQLSDVLSINSRLTRAEAYNQADAVMDVALNFGRGTVSSAGFELYQNVPNPFKGETIIGFNLPEAATATIKVNDVTGRMLKVIRGDFAQGYNQISLSSQELPAIGVLYYTVETAKYTATKKMIIID
jgi:hypothetical protein